MKTPTKPKPRPAMATGDAIYYEHPDTGQAHHGYVAGIGKHGMLVDADGGGEHKVPWASYLAHRLRIERKLTVIDKGEDGAICTDESGKRVFLHGKVPDGDDLTKALSGELQTADEARNAAAVRDALAPVLAAMQAMQAQHQQSLDRFASLIESAIGRPLPEIRVSVPEQKPANVQVDVHVPQQPAPNVNVAAPVLPAPVVNVTIPPKNTVTTIERDRDGNMTRATQTEQPA